MKSRALASCRKLGDPEGSIEDNTAVHQALLDQLNAAALADGWPGSAVTQYVIIDDHVSITVVPGPALATVEDIRKAWKHFRQAQLAENDNRKNGKLI